MQLDRYGHRLSTASAAARDAYVAGADLLLSANGGAIEAFERALGHDPGFALGHAGHARALQAWARLSEARAAMARAEALAGGLDARQSSHINALGLVIAGRPDEALAAIRAHLEDWPRDAPVLQPATGVFGLIGFSGRSGREEEHHALLAPLEPMLGGDWWYEAALAFAEVESGRVAKGRGRVQRALALNPRNANAAHVMAHALYEGGEPQAGIAFLDGWRADYARTGVLHGHLAWHAALWALETGDTERALALYAAEIAPGAAAGPPLNVLTDAASFLFRAGLLGCDLKPGLWVEVSGYASRLFPSPGVAFADVHAALAHAMAGDEAAFARIAGDRSGSVAGVTGPLAGGLASLARGDWAGAVTALSGVADAHERIGGSRAQRDLVELALITASLRSGATEVARNRLARRAVLAPLLPDKPQA